jgi:hypothetical protein
MVSEVLLSPAHSFSPASLALPSFSPSFSHWKLPWPKRTGTLAPIPCPSHQPWASCLVLALTPCGLSERLAPSPAATPHFSIFRFFFLSFPELTRSRCGARWLERWGEEGGGWTASQTGGKGGD